MDKLNQELLMIVERMGSNLREGLGIWEGTQAKYGEFSEQEVQYLLRLPRILRKLSLMPDSIDYAGVQVPRPMSKGEYGRKDGGGYYIRDVAFIPSISKKGSQAVFKNHSKFEDYDLIYNTQEEAEIASKAILDRG